MESIIKQLWTSIIINVVLILGFIVRMAWLSYTSGWGQWEVFIDGCIVILICSQLGTSLDQFRAYKKEMKNE